MPGFWQLKSAVKNSPQKSLKINTLTLGYKAGTLSRVQQGEPSAWIISDKDYLKLTGHKESIVDFFQRSPHRDIDLQIERRKDLPRLMI